MRTRFKWHRALVNPTTHILSVDGDITRLRVDGLVCSSVCAVRTKQALRGIDGVRRVTVDFDSGIATIEGAPHDATINECAVPSVVAGKPLRRAIERIARRVRGVPASSLQPPASPRPRTDIPS